MHLLHDLRCVHLLHDSVPWWLVRRSRAALVRSPGPFALTAFRHSSSAPLSPPRARTPLESGRSRQFHTCGHLVLTVPRVQVKRRPSAARFLPAPTQMALCLRLCLLQLLRRELLRAFATLDDSTPQRRISELRVWSYEPFIVFAPSSSGYTSGQNLEVLYIIRNII